MSTDAVSMKLKRLDKEVELVEKHQLPWYKRFWRRYATGRMFIATQLIFEPYGFVKGLFVASKVTGKPFLVLIAAEFPKVADFFATIWEACVLTWAHLTS